MNLVIVESPTKVKSVGRYLGKGYIVMASYGHIRDLPVKTLGVDLEHGFKPYYEENKQRGRNLINLKTTAKKVDTIYLASDPDREGEAIAWHLREVLSKVNRTARFFRVTYNQITKAAVEEAFRHPRDIDMALVDSQQARRVIDRIVGYQVSPLLWKQEDRGASAGRVQSVAQRLICEREREILSFQPKEYWNFEADFQAWNNRGIDPKDLIFRAKLTAMDGLSGNNLIVDNKDSADKILNDVRRVQNWQVSKVDKTPKKRFPFPPFITSTLQQVASNALGFSSSKTMRIAQELFEGVDVGNGSVGLITYMRTDSVAVAPEAQQATRAFLISKLGQQFVPFRPPVYKSKGNAQEAHEAIRPTDVNYIPKLISAHLSSDQMKLYDLIWRRFVASQMAPAETMLTAVDVSGKSDSSRTGGGHFYTFHSTATVTTFPGFLRVYHVKDSNAEDDTEQRAQVLGNLSVNQRCDMLKAENAQKFTEPKPRFTEATLIHELEAHGIGRPSTYASIIETILKRKYTEKEKGKLIPTPLGFRVVDFLVKNMKDLFDVNFTMEMEKSLDDVGSGDLQWTALMEEFYKKFCFWYDSAKNSNVQTSEKVGALLNEMGKITRWQEPVASGKKKPYDEHKFFESVLSDFSKKGAITTKQWNSLLFNALQHEDELPALHEIAQNFGFVGELAEAQDKGVIRMERQEMDRLYAEKADAQSWLNPVFEALTKVQWKEPVTIRRKKYDDAEICKSFRDRLESGKPLTDKQLSFFYNIFLSYEAQIPDFEILKRMFAEKVPAITKKQTPGKTVYQKRTRTYSSKGSGSDGKVVRPVRKTLKNGNSVAGSLISALSSVKVWNAPVKRGAKTYDDGEFFKSVKNQYLGGKDLTTKQIAALQKMAAKYGVPVVGMPVSK